MNINTDDSSCHGHPICRLFPTILAGWLGLAVSSGISQTNPAPVQMTDNFANRPTIVLSSVPGLPYAYSSAAEVYGNVSNATAEADEPYVPGVSSGETLWATWSAPLLTVGPITPPGQPHPNFIALLPVKGVLTLTASAGTFSPLLTVYQGNSLATLSLLASNNFLACYSDGACGCHWRERNQISFHVTNSLPYQLCVDSAIITDAAWEYEQLPEGTYPGSPYQWAPVQEINFNGPYDWSFYVVEQTTNNLVGGDFQLDLQFTPSPPNDDFTARTKLAGSRLSIMATNAGATKEMGEPNHEGNPGGSSVWYSWTAPASGRATISTNEIPVYSPPSASGGNGEGAGLTTILVNQITPTCGTEIDQNPPPDFYPVFGVYTGSALNALTSADTLPMSLAAYPDAVEFDAAKGQTYQIAFDGNLGTTGVIPLNLALTTPAANSNFKNRIQLHGVSVIATGYNAGAIHQAGEPILTGSTGKNVWWSWRAPVTGTVSVDLTGSDYAFPVAVFTGSTPATLKGVAESTGGLSFEAVQGVTYQIAVADDNGLTGAIKLDLLGPIIDLPLLSSQKAQNGAILTYRSTSGEVAALLYSTDAENWAVAQTKNTSGGSVEFLTKPAPGSNGPYYRAIFFNRVGF